jgi:hypothetical protein
VYIPHVAEVPEKFHWSAARPYRAISVAMEQCTAQHGAFVAETFLKINFKALFHLKNGQVPLETRCITGVDTTRLSYVTGDASARHL